MPRLTGWCSGRDDIAGDIVERNTERRSAATGTRVRKHPAGRDGQLGSLRRQSHRTDAQKGFGPGENELGRGPCHDHVEYRPGYRPPAIASASSPCALLAHNKMV